MSPLPAYLLSPGALDWLDAVAGSVLLYALLSWLFPALLRPVLWVLATLLYRLSWYGRGRVPAKGGVLVVCNHVSYVDWLVLWVACPRRPTFVLWSTYDRSPVLRFFLSWARR